MTKAEPVKVWGDGGTRDGVAVHAGGGLAAVLTRLDGEDAGGDYRAGDWFLEAGFGPCGLIGVAQPPAFGTLEQAIAWVDAKVTRSDGDGAA